MNLREKSGNKMKARSSVLCSEQRIRGQALSVLMAILTTFITGCKSSDLFTDAQSSSSNLPPEAKSALVLIPQIKFVPVGGTFQFSAVGGKAPYTFKMKSEVGEVGPTGFFTAPSAPGLLTLQVTDSTGDSRESTVIVNQSMSCSSNSTPLSMGQTAQISCAGGVMPYSYAIASGGGGSVDPITGIFTPGWVNATSVQITDSAGNVMNSAFTVNPSVRSFGTLGQQDGVLGLKLDSSSNLFVVGKTNSGLDGKLNSGDSDAYLIKYDSNGAKQWTVQAGSSSADFFTSVAVDSDQNILAAGTTDGVPFTGVNQGGSDVVLAKYDTAGTRLWSVLLGTSGNEVANAVVTDSAKNIYVVGTTTSNFNGFVSGGGTDMFVAKYDLNGVQKWVQQLGSSGNDLVKGSVLDSQGNIYLAGTTTGGLYSKVSSGQNDVFLIKLNSTGVMQWTQQIGTTGNDEANQVTMGKDGFIYIAGASNGNFDGNVNSSGQYHMILLKYDSTGAKLLSKQLSVGTNIDSANSIALDDAGSIFLAGYTTGNFNGVVNQGSLDTLVVKLDHSGSLLWSYQTGTSASDIANAVITDKQGYVFLGGLTQINSGGIDGLDSTEVGPNYIMKLDSLGVRQ
jgi:hypothetical protein